MPDKLYLSQAVLVEGKYDKARLASMLDALIVPVDGFRIFRDKPLQAYIRSLACSCGVVILTDSDAAGFRIRTRLSELARGGSAVHVYIPDLSGKEPRKAKPSAEAKLGVEGIPNRLLYEAFSRAGLCGVGERPAVYITRQDLYDDGLIGAANSSELRRSLCHQLGLPARLSVSSLLETLARAVAPEEYQAALEAVRSQIQAF